MDLILTKLFKICMSMENLHIFLSNKFFIFSNNIIVINISKLWSIFDGFPVTSLLAIEFLIKDGLKLQTFATGFMGLLNFFYVLKCSWLVYFYVSSFLFIFFRRFENLF